MSARRSWIPNQHGAWAFLIGPTALAAALTGPRALHAVILGAWLCAYCANFFLGLAVKSRARAGAWRAQRTKVAAYATPAVLGAAWVVSVDRAALWVAPVLAAAFVVNVAAILSRKERAWVNDISGIVASAGVGLAAIHATDGNVASALASEGLLTAYFVGTVFYVKTMIRDRGSAAALRASVAWHVASLAAALVLRPWSAPVFTAALVRAIVMPGRTASPKQIGVAEAAVSMAMLVALSLG